MVINNTHKKCKNSNTFYTGDARFYCNDCKEYYEKPIDPKKIKKIEQDIIMEMIRK